MSALGRKWWHKGIPFPLKTVRLIVSHFIVPMIRKRRVGAPADCLGMHGVLDPVATTNVYVANPGWPPSVLTLT